MQTVKETVHVPGIKVELQVIFPAAETEMAVKAQKKQGRKYKVKTRKAGELGVTLKLG